MTNKTTKPELNEYDEAVYEAVKGSAPAGMREIVRALGEQKQPIMKSSIRRAAKLLDAAKLISFYQSPPVGWVFDLPGKKNRGRLVAENREKATSKKATSKKAPAKKATSKKAPAKKALAKKAPAKKARATKKATSDDGLFQSALALKQEVYDGKRSPRSALEELAKRYPDEKAIVVDDAWTRAWWHGLPGAAHQVDQDLLKSMEFAIFSGKGKKGDDGEGRPLQATKWYFSPPGFEGTYSKPYGSKAAASKAAAASARQLMSLAPKSSRARKEVAVATAPKKVRKTKAKKAPAKKAPAKKARSKRVARTAELRKKPASSAKKKASRRPARQVG